MSRFLIFLPTAWIHINLRTTFQAWLKPLSHQANSDVKQIHVCSKSSVWKQNPVHSNHCSSTTILQRNFPSAELIKSKKGVRFKWPRRGCFRSSSEGLWVTALHPWGSLLSTVTLPVLAQALALCVDSHWYAWLYPCERSASNSPRRKPPWAERLWSERTHIRDADVCGADINKHKACAIGAQRVIPLPYSASSFFPSAGKEDKE